MLNSLKFPICCKVNTFAKLNHLKFVKIWTTYHLIVYSEFLFHENIKLHGSIKLKYVHLKHISLSNSENILKISTRIPCIPDSNLLGSREYVLPSYKLGQIGTANLWVTRITAVLEKEEHCKYPFSHLWKLEKGLEYCASS